jgi:hypothetical protein
MRRVFAGVALYAVCSACAPHPDSAHKPAWGLSGQSNAEKLAPFLQSYATVVGYSKTSTTIDAWGPGGPMWVRLAPSLSRPMSAFIWWQGESNNNDPAGSYRASLADLVARIRRAANAPDLLFVVIRVGPNYRPPGATIWNEEDAFVSADRHAILIPSDDLEFVDAIHMTPAGYTAMAARIAATLGVR